MNLKNLLRKLTDELDEDGVAAPAGPATQTADVPGVPKVFGIVRRKYPGYEEDRREKKKRKRTHHRSPMQEDGAGMGVVDGGAGGGADGASGFVSGTSLGKKAFAGERPKYRPKKKFFARPQGPGKKKIAKKEMMKEDDWQPFQQTPPDIDRAMMAKAFAGMRPDYKPKSPEITGQKKKKKKKIVKENFMGPQIFNDTSPYKDLEYITKFWRGNKAGQDVPQKKSKKMKKKAGGPFSPADQEANRWTRLGRHEAQ